MNAITPFDFHDQLVRVVDMDNEPWFIASDVCKVLSLSNTSRAVESLDDDEKGITNSNTPGGQGFTPPSHPC